jgi:2-methylcitrate dehydratase PrpD
VEGHHWTAVLQTTHPTTTEEAQFSLKWSLAAYIVDGVVGPNQILESRLSDPKINFLVDKITLVESEELNRLYRPIFEGREGGIGGSRVIIYLDDDRILDSGLVSDSCRIEASGDEERLEEKFRWLTSFVIDGNRINDLLDMLWNFDALRNVNELTSLLRKR